MIYLDKEGALLRTTTAEGPDTLLGEDGFDILTASGWSPYQGSRLNVMAMASYVSEAEAKKLAQHLNFPWS